MDSSEAGLDRIESQRLEDDHQILIDNGAFTLSPRGFVESGGQSTPPPTENIESIPEFHTSLRLPDLYNLPGEYVPMNPEIFSAMRGGNIKFLEEMKSYSTPMACFKNDKGDSILHIAAAWGHLRLVNGIVSESPSLLLESNWKDMLPLHVAAHAGHSEIVKTLVASITSLSTRLSEQGRDRLNLYVLKDIHGNTALHLALKDLDKKAELSMYQKCSIILLPLTRRWKARSAVTDTSARQIETAACLVKANNQASFLANKDGVSPLYMATEAGSLFLVNAMLNLACNNISQLQGRKSLVHAALRSKSIDVLDVILKEDPSLVDAQDEQGRTCLSVGASVGFYAGIKKLLLQSTSSVYKRDGDGSFSIHMAVDKGHMNIAEELLKHCPDSQYLLNKHGQNILHIAAKSGKAESFLLDYVKRFDTKNHLMEEQDVDGNTPLHLATINWRPRTLRNLTEFAISNPKILNIQNKDGLRPLDIAEINLQYDYVFRERMTLMVLLYAYTQTSDVWRPTTGITLKSISDEHRISGGGGDKYKEQINVLLVVAVLIATMTFAAGFTIPGGFSSSKESMGMAILADDLLFSSFLIFDTIALHSSVIAILSLLWVQLGDPEIIHRAFTVAMPSLYFALICMSYAFISGVLATTKHSNVVFIFMGIIFIISSFVFALLFVPYVWEQGSSSVVLHLLLWFVNEDGPEKHHTSGSGESGLKIKELVGSLSDDQVEKSKVLSER